MQLYDYQKQAVQALVNGKHFVIAGVGLGKTAIGLAWAKATGRSKVLVVTTASVRDQGNYPAEAPVWCGEEWVKSLSSFSVVSWAGLAKWVQANWDDLDEYAVIADEVACMKAGISSNRGKAFLQIAKRTPYWAGFTATPGDRWIDFYAYFTACGYVKNKTQFQRDFCTIQTFKGFPEIVGYRNEELLKKWWEEVSYVPDASKVMAELPAETNQTVLFKQPTGYKQVLKTRETLEGEFIDNHSALSHYCRQLCSSKEKLTWLAEFLENLNTNCVVFYNYTTEANQIEEVCRKLKRKVWRIDGSVHDIPTPETIGSRDVVLVQYQAGSMGLNLQFMNYCVFFSPNYSYSLSRQAKGRIKRIGQTKHCHYYFLRCQNTIEDAVFECLKTKGDFSTEVWYMSLK